MSLLMEALKHAENTKQSQASRRSDTSRVEDGQTLSLDPMQDLQEESRSSEPQSETFASEDITDSTAQPEIHAREERSGGFNSEDAQAFTAHALDAPTSGMVEKTKAGLSARTVTPRNREGIRSLSDETSTTFPSLQKPTPAVDDDVEATRLGLEPIGLGSSADGLSVASRRSSDSDPQRTAQSVFNAKTPASHAGRRWLVLGGASLLLVALLGGGYYFWQTLHEGSSLVPWQGLLARSAPLPRSRGQPGAPMMEELNGPSTRPPTTISPSELNSSLVSRTTGTPQAQELPLPSENTSEQPTPAAATLARREESDGSASGEMQMPQGAVAAGSKPPSADILRSTGEKQSPGATGLADFDSSLKPPGAISIARQQAPDQTHLLLTRAFRAFQRGNDTSAKDDYQKVLAVSPNNRDALLGLAAVALRNREWEDASSLYLRLLALDPTDSVAQAALIGMQENLDPVAGENRIKGLLAREPDAPYLHFCLGGLYALQSRWTEAQAAYFNAYRIDSQRADYAFNLAVSLDHLAQTRAALTYYRRALALANEQPVGFRPAVVRKRIQEVMARPMNAQ